MASVDLNPVGIAVQGFHRMGQESRSKIDLGQLRLDLCVGDGIGTLRNCPPAEQAA
ncbi:hypothetical protein [Mesorhizobium sp. WSM3862]|uniref:hypothetical protein n=1 Tax=Mesorhizobium sp. WSM3862 TaxID=632858 RepID=UPI00159691CE|nr:hypothetical protein [Mesorhizobium sp. WSM3862]